MPSFESDNSKPYVSLIEWKALNNFQRHAQNKRESSKFYSFQVFKLKTLKLLNNVAPYRSESFKALFISEIFGNMCSTKCFFLLNKKAFTPFSTKKSCTKTYTYICICK